jgi:predicted RNA-binding Zn-ribbon protein involved in translation (DUF1610 family)
MKNSELLSTDAPPSRLLNGLERQRQYVLRIEVGPFACPNCGTEHAKWEIHGITNVNDYDLSKSHGDEGKCKACGRGLRYMVPFVGNPYITLISDPELAR